MSRPATLRVATAGNPNVGKSSLINALAGSDLKVGNWPGTTVSQLSVRFNWEGTEITWVDLPGTYSLAGATSEETITREELLNHPPDLVVNVVDAGNLERNLGLTLELCELGIPMVLALNLVDEAQQNGVTVDIARLSERLGVDVVETVAPAGRGIAQLRHALLTARPSKLVINYSEGVAQALDQLAIEAPGLDRWRAVTILSEDVEGLEVSATARSLRTRLEGVEDPFFAVSEARLGAARGLVAGVERRQQTGPSRTERLDRLVLHRGLGLPLFALGMLLVFRFTYLFSDPWIGFLDVVKTVFSGWVAACHLPDLLESFLIRGVLDGAGTVAAFSPVLFLLYLSLAFLEGSGLLSRVAFLCDQVMKWVGLPGRSLIPLLLGFGCNVPAIYSTRILPNAGDRLRVALAVPFMSCSARLAVFVLFGAVFFPTRAPSVVFLLYALGLALGLFTAWFTRRLTPPDSDLTGILELPPYRFPSAAACFRQARLRTRSFLRNAGGMILGAVLLVWFLHQVPAGPPERSYYARVSQALTVPLRPLGITDWRLAGALIPGFIAKEVVIGTLGVSFLGDEPTVPTTLPDGLATIGVGLKEALRDTVLAVPRLAGVMQPADDPPPEGLSAALARAVTPQAAFAYLVFLLLYTPCVATLAAIKNEFGARWAWFSLIWELSVAWILGVVAFQVWTWW